MDSVYWVVRHGRTVSLTLTVLAMLAIAPSRHSAAQVPASPPPQAQPEPQPQPDASAAPTTPTAATTTEVGAAFSQWLEGVRDEAVKRGIRPETIKQAFDGVEPVAQILERDRAQAEFTLTTQQYFDRRLTRDTLATAKQYARQHRDLLLRIYKAFGVPPRYLISVWGLESNFGRFAGIRPMIPTLATLAFDQRRAAYFREELFDALQVIDRGYIDLPALKGSWAGAMGQPQFMPSSYLAYAQDFDNDGKRDIWTSPPDVFASIAFYLKERGWEADQTWGRQVKFAETARTRITEAVPFRTTGCRAVRQLTEPRPLRTWRQLGIRRVDGGPLPNTDQAASLLQTDDNRRYLVSRNYEAVLAYNCAHTYALSVSMLGDAVDGLGKLPVSKAARKPAKKGKGKPHAKPGARKPVRAARAH
jgi:membrane-bound lytic murein transglycosylase B